MVDPTNNIGNVIRKVRSERGLTLDETAGITGVSKAMLGQIERGKSNPTISILWKIAAGLKISFSELLGSEDEIGEIIDIEGIDPVYESEGKMILHDVFPYNPISGFELFYIKMLPGGYHVSPPHQSSTEEHIIVTEGTLVIDVDGRHHVLKAPSALKFKSNLEHVYSNPYTVDVVFQSIVKY
ncbi:MAG: helix-turn-helix transcriptional regulator [Clostridia bacterium]|nr:helix-turn-helix transcriptional regulator [Clostridia bacterium]